MSVNRALPVIFRVVTNQVLIVYAPDTDGSHLTLGGTLTVVSWQFLEFDSSRTELSYYIYI